MSQEDLRNPTEQKKPYEELQVAGEQLVGKIKELLHEGNVRRVIIKQDGHAIMEIPLTIGVVGLLAAPQLAAIGAIAALISRCTVEIVRSEKATLNDLERKGEEVAANVAEKGKDFVNNVKGQSEGYGGTSAE